MTIRDCASRDVRREANSGASANFISSFLRRKKKKRTLVKLGAIWARTAKESSRDAIVNHSKKWYFLRHLLVVILTLFPPAIIKAALRDIARNQRGREKQMHRIRPSYLWIKRNWRNAIKYATVCEKRYAPKWSAVCDLSQHFHVFRIQKVSRVVFALGESGISCHHARYCR